MRFRSAPSFAMFLLVLLFLFSGRAWSSTEALSGYWFTEGEEHGVYAQFIENRTSDGIFLKRIRQIENCRAVREWTESGTWEYSDGAIKQATEFVSNAATDYHDVYQVLAQNRDTVKIHDTETAIDWTLTRVTAAFKFPPPKNCPVS